MLKVAALENVGVLSARLAQAIDEDDVLQLEAILVSTRLLDERASQALGAMRKLAAESEMAEAQEQARAELGW